MRRVSAWVLSVLICLASVAAKQEAGLILNGVDTIQSPQQYGFDFVLGEPCTTTDWHEGCVVHLFFAYVGSNATYHLSSMASPTYVGFGMPLGKLNLDSVTSAPADTTMQRLGGYTMDSIPPNDLASRIGNVYVMKTGFDPRPGGNPMYAKIKILKFIVHDTITHDIDMIFLWACNLSGYPDLATEGLDTFHLDTTPVSVSPSSHSRMSSLVSNVSAHAVMRIARSGLVVERKKSVWDLRGRRIGVRGNDARTPRRPDTMRQR